MILKMLRSACGPRGSFVAGGKYDVPDDLAVELLNSGAAEAVKEQADNAVSRAPEVAILRAEKSRRGILRKG